MFSAPGTAERHHHLPVGRRRAAARSISPAGSARSAAAVNGRSGGSSSLVARYLVPHPDGASAVNTDVFTDSLRIADVSDSLELSDMLANSKRSSRHSVAVRGYSCMRV